MPNEVTVTPPDHALKRKLGRDVDIKGIFTPAAIASADSALAESREDFFTSAAGMIERMEEAYARAPASAADAPAAAGDIVHLSGLLKSRAEALGFDLLAHVCKSLYGFCSGSFRAGDEEQLVVLRKHLDILQLIMRERIREDGGESGRSLLAELERLTARYA